MSANQGGVGQVLGASTAIVGGISTLPNTGGSFLVTALAVFAVSLGIIVLLSFVSTRIVKKFVK